MKFENSSLKSGERAEWARQQELLRERNVEMQRQKRAEKSEIYKKSAMALESMSHQKSPKVIYEAVKLAFQLRKEMDEYNPAVFHVAFIFALMADGADIIPFVGPVLSLGSKVMIFVLFFGKRSMIKRWMTRRAIQLMALMFFADLLPIINKLPWTTISVYMVYHKMKNKSKAAEIELEALEKKVVGVNPRDYFGNAAADGYYN